MNPHRIHVPFSLPRPALAALAALILLAASPTQVPDPVGRIHPAAQPLADIATLVVPGLDRTSIAAEDEQRRRNGQPARYAIPHAVTATPATHGTWQSLDATWSLWRLRVQAPGANHINLGFRRFWLPAGARVQIYSSDYSDLVRPFDVADHQPTLDLWTPVCGTEEIVVELYVMEAQRPLVQLELQQVGSGYRFFGAGSDALLPVERGTCNIDVTCPLGATWAQEIPAVAAISSAGSIFCSGAMINNTAQDGRNFFLTANHCGVTSGIASSLVCYWNYRNTTCGGSDANLLQFTTGATFRSTSTATDFTLLELNQTPNAAWGVSYLGWNRGTGDTTSATAIHHPSGEPKKISFEYQATTTTSYGGTAVPGNGTHIRITDWDDGTTEGGSSGSPLFDQNKRVVGQLHGGSAACGNDFSDWYGRFSGSWTGGGTDATRLSNWLDPLNTGALTLDTRLPASGTVAAATSYGAGCYDTQGAFAQTFAASTFDLSGTATSTVGRSFVPIANGYTVQNGPNAWFTPTSANLGLGD
nr:serine protease [Planctomycetota bacterium]